jgi:hypothetical protein
MLMQMKSKSLIVVIIIASVAVTIGCGPQRAERPDRAIVSGTITYQGKPVSGGNIAFIAASGGNTASGVLKSDGSYSIDDAPIGQNQVSIDTESIKPYLGPNYVKLPEKYLSPEKSGLTFEVKAGENTDVNFTLEGE